VIRPRIHKGRGGWWHVVYASGLVDRCGDWDLALEMVESYYTNRVKSPTDECRACDQDRTGWCGTWPDDDQAERDAAVRHHLAEALDRIRGA
jgi:hypothetical protein